ncbi:MAG: hypothetical protein OXU26_07195 [Acidobacteriota bacterium]|nr:hypothetical protein [Acidobacteriota bacterium]
MNADTNSWRLFGLLACLFLLFQLWGPYSVQAQERKVVEVGVSDSDRLKGLLSKGTIEGRLMDGTVLSGKVKDLRDEWLVLNIRKTVPLGSFPKGEKSLLIRDFSRIQVTRYEGNARTKASIILGAAGFGLGLLASATEFAGESFNRTYGSMILGFTAAGTVGGYFWGRAFDKKSTLVKLRTSSDDTGP